MRALALAVVTCSLLLACGAARAVDRVPPAAALDAALVAGLKQTGAPGGQAAIYRCGSLVWSSAAGVDDLRSKRPVTPETRFVLASVTKMFTGTLIMQLVERGRLSLDTRLSRYYPSLPNAASITVEMLLRHTSGLPEYWDDSAVSAALDDPRHVWTRDDVLRGLRRAVFKPGRQYRYTNSNFVVLGGILEQAGGESVQQAFEDQIAGPLHLTHSSFVSPPRDSALYAHPYSVGDNGKAVDSWVPGYGIGSDTVGPVWTDGGLASTATDIARFSDALFNGGLVGPATLAALTAIDSNAEGLGVEASQFDGSTWLGHSGSYGGFESELWYDRSRGVTIAVTTNRDESSSANDTTSDVIWSKIAGAYDRAAPDPAPCHHARNRTAAVPPPQTPAGRQLAWLIGRLNGTSVPSTAVLEQHFSAGFLAAVPPPKLLEVLGSIYSGRPFHVASVVSQDGPLRLVADMESSHGATFRVTISVTATAAHQIDGLVLQPVAAPLASWRAVDGALRKLAPHVSLYAGDANGRPIHSLDGNDAGAIGSAFKFYVLGALAWAIEDGHARWDQQLAIHEAWKSLPSGAMQDEPDGAKFSLRHYAEQMISVSDNTAADHLIHFLGRWAIEAELTALGNRSVAADEPFLTTREMFALKLAAPASLRNAYVRDGSAGRRALLTRVDRLVPTLAETANWIAPREIGQIEWFASPVDLAHAVAALVGAARRPGLAPLRAILAINPGTQLDAKRWPYVGFKGGSEPGVLSLTWYLERADGRTFVLSIVINDDRQNVDEAAAVSVATAAIGLLARTG